MIEDIIKLKEQGVSFRKIAKELGTTVGKVQYQWVKYHKALGSGLVTAEIEVKEPQVSKKRIGRASFGRKMADRKDGSRRVSGVSVTFSTPSRIYCYWDIPAGWVRHIQNHFNMNTDPQPYVLRLYDITSIAFNGHNHHAYTDTYVPHTETEWFVNGLKENRSYCMEVGLRLPAGDFIAISRSNVIHTPRTSHHQEWHSMKELTEFEQGFIQEPKWVEHVSTYSYYVMNREGKA
ncbi:DUF4912 domain-containing protein [Bacillus sp. KH172YL63]|uniref:DUF4912 domain-containing protein n=1 Tax=Bacillus sp. KH172YL63 TaxID=2709784 RepID=UPI0013E42477|nr:DUF4912 domain-containing protein [Bacillus sp. KH172YL63]BCB04822.1 hypothetical protein KH172YL63_29550 [Bacillus sp. KH172YL63]